MPEDKIPEKKENARERQHQEQILKNRRKSMKSAGFTQKAIRLMRSAVSPATQNGLSKHT